MYEHQCGWFGWPFLVRNDNHKKKGETMNNKEFLCSLTALLWKYYILQPTKENFEEMFSYFSQELVMIGTGKHEFYTNTHQILESLKENQIEAESISFDVLDEWYECMMVTEDVYLVYGGIWARQQGKAENEALIEMDTRFSMLYRKRNEGWEIVHIHHSVPYIEQQSGEYYPKTLIEQAKEAMDLAKLFQRKSEMDLMTELYNNVSFKHRVVEQMDTGKKGNFYLFDLDHFKSVNDTYGHPTGDELLILFSSILKQDFGAEAVLGRMGGDEFAVFEYAPWDRGAAIQRIMQMQESFENETRKILSQGTASFSVGIASLIGGQCSYDKLFSNADQALYHAKQLGRQTYHWHDE